MEYDTQQEGEVTVVALRGSVAVADALELRNLLGTRLSDGTSRVLLDFSSVDFIDSAGIGVLVSARRRAQESGARIALAGVHGAVARVLQLTRTDRLLETHATVEDGVRALS